MQPSSPGAPPIKAGAFRVFIELLAFAALVGVTAVFLRPLKEDIDRRMIAVRDGFIARAEGAAGRRIVYESLGPSILGTLDARGVRVVGADGQAVASASRVRIGFSLFDLLSGGALPAVESVSIDRLRLDLDAARDADLLSALGKPAAASRVRAPGGAGDLSGLAGLDAALRLRSASISWTDGPSRAALTDVDVDARLKGGPSTFRAKARAEIAFPGFPAELGVLSGRFSFSGSADLSAETASATVSVAELSSAAFSAKTLTFLFAFSPEGATVRKIRDKARFDFSGAWDASSRKASAELKMDAFVPASIVVIGGAWAAADAWLGSTLTGSVRVEFASGEALAYDFDVEGRAPRVSLPAALGPFSFAARGSGGADSVAFSRLRLDAPNGSASFEGSLSFLPLSAGLVLPVPDGRLSIAGLASGRRAALDVEADLSWDGDRLYAFADSLKLGTLDLAAVEFSLVPSPQSLAFGASALRYDADEDSLDVRVGRFEAEGELAADLSFLQGQVSFDSFPAADIRDLVLGFLPGGAETAQPLAFLDDAAFTTEIFATTDFKNLSYNAPRFVAAIAGGADAFLVGSFAGTEDRLAVRDASLIWRGGSASSSLEVDFSDSREIDFSVSVAYGGLDYAASGSLLDGQSLSVQGDFGLRANVSFLGGLGASGAFSVDAMPLAVAGMRIAATARASFRAAGPASWSVDVQQAVLERTDSPDGLPRRLSFSGSADPRRASADAVSYEDASGMLSGSVSADFLPGFGGGNAVARFADRSGRERYELEASLADGVLSGRLYAAQGRPARFAELGGLSAAVTGEARFRWASEDDFEVSWSLPDLRASYKGEEILAASYGTADPLGLLAENTRVAYGGYLAELPRLEVALGSSSASLSFRLRGTAVGRDADISAVAGLAFDPVAGWREAERALDSFRGTVDVSAFRVGTVVLEPFGLAVEKRGAELSARGGPADALRLQAAADGAFYAALSAPSPLRGTLVGEIVDGRIRARASGLYVDLPALWDALPSADVDFTGGIATGNLEVDGVVGDPDIRGSVRVSGARILVPAWVGAEIGPVSADVLFEGGAVRFGPVAVQVGTGSARVAGSLALDRWVPSNVELDVDIPGVSPVPARSDVAGILVRGLASGRLSIRAGDDGFSLKGGLLLEAVMTTLDAEAMVAMQRSAWEPFPAEIDLSLRIGRKVEFAWPTADFPVLRGYADTGDGLRIVWNGMTGRFSLAGDVAFRGGEVFYFQRNFYIREGRLRFAENELRFDPEISLRAELRDRVQTGSVTISLVVDQAPLSSFTPRFESEPALSQTEIFSLLGQNLSGADGRSGTGIQNQVLGASTDILAQFNVVRVFERNVRDILNLDMFSVRTQLLQNVVLEAAGLRGDPVDRTGGLGNYFDNTTVYMGKYVGSGLFLQGMFSLQYDPLAERSSVGGLRPEVDFGIEMKTPLFMLKWSFLPTRWESLFIDDHAFTVTWKRTF